MCFFFLQEVVVQAQLYHVCTYLGMSFLYIMATFTNLIQTELTTRIVQEIAAINLLLAF